VTGGHEVAGSSPVAPISQTFGKKAVTKTKKWSSEIPNQKLAPSLFFDCKNDPDLRLLVDHWPELPLHIKAAIKALVQTHKTEKK
jgi:hypothetical protein